MINLSIETLVLVAAWSTPSIFQGSFTITNKQDQSTQLLFFRCECRLTDETDILDIDFSPNDYQFTHLYSGQSAIHLESIGTEVEQALYLLKYALNATLEQMITNSKQYLTYVDEVAMSSMSNQIAEHMANLGQREVEGDLGFSVSIDFNPTEKLGETAALTLLRINRLT